MNRPRRSLQHTSYEDPSESESDSQDEENLASLSDSSDSLSVATASEEEPIYSGDVVRLPTASEIVETQRVIRARITELATFKLEYEEAKQKLEIIESKCLRTAREILEGKAYLARIRALPQEVLSLVFSFYTDDPSQSPWTLMQVTRTWRMTALFTRTIWTRIMIASPVWKERGRKRSHEGREVCVAPKQLDRALRRAGNSPLDVVLDCTERMVHPYDLDRQAFERMISILASPKRRSLVRHFTVQGPHAWILLVLETTSLTFPGLETVTIPDKSLTWMTEALLKNSRHVRKLAITATDLVCYANNGFTTPSQLRDIFINAPVDEESISLVDADSLRGCLQGALLVTTLEIARLGYDPSLPATVITLPNLKTLVLRWTSLVWYLDAPSLTSLTCFGVCSLRAGAGGRNNLPLLKAIKSMMYGGDSSLAESLKGVILPSLQDLEIVCHEHSLADTVLEFISEHRHKLVIFRLERAVLPKQELANLVCSMPLLEELELDRVKFTKGFFTLFTPPNTSSKKPASLLPDSHHFPCMIRLKVDLSGCSLRGQTKAIKAEAKRVIKARVKAGIPTEMAQIRFSEEQGWIDLIPRVSEASSLMH